MMASFLTPRHPWDETGETDDPESFAEQAAELMRAVATGEVVVPGDDAVPTNAAVLYEDLTGATPAANVGGRIVTANIDKGHTVEFMKPKHPWATNDDQEQDDEDRVVNVDYPGREERSFVEPQPYHED